MPIIEAHKAKTTFCLKRGKGAGFSGLENQLYRYKNRMIYGDAKATITSMIAQFKRASSKLTRYKACFHLIKLVIDGLQ